MHHLQLSDPEDHDVDRLRTFNTSKGGKCRLEFGILKWFVKFSYFINANYFNY